MEKVTFLNPEFFWLFLLLPGLIFWVIQKRKVQTAGNKIKNIPRTAQRLLTKKLLYGSKSSQTEEADNESALTSADSLDIQASLRCIKSSTASCINIPFKTLLGIIMVGIFFGIFMAFLLIKPLLNKVDIP